MVSRASSKVSGARIEGSRLASMVLPEPGGPIIRMLWLPAAATSRARLAVCWPRTSLEVHGEVLQLAQQRFSGDAVGLALDDAHHRRVEQLQHIQQRGGGIDVDALHHGGLGGVGGGQNQVGNALFAGQDGHRQHAGHGAHAAVQSQFAHQQEAAQVVGPQRAVSAQDADGDGQVEARAFLLQVGGSQVDGDEGGRNQVAGVLDGGAHAVAALAHRGVGQAHGVEDVLVHHHAAIVDLDIDEVWRRFRRRPRCEL